MLSGRSTQDMGRRPSQRPAHGGETPADTTRIMWEQLGRSYEVALRELWMSALWHSAIDAATDRDANKEVSH